SCSYRGVQPDGRGARRGDRAGGVSSFVTFGLDVTIATGRGWERDRRPGWKPRDGCRSAPGAACRSTPPAQPPLPPEPKTATPLSAAWRTSPSWGVGQVPRPFATTGAAGTLPGRRRVGRGQRHVTSVPHRGEKGCGQ